MALPSSDGAGAAAGQVQVILDEIEAIGRKQLPSAQDDATAATQPFRNLELDPNSFGEIPVARSLGVQHGAAHEVFVATVETVIQDLNDFAATLVASMQAHQATDEGIHSALIAFNGSYGERGSRAEETFDEARTEQGDRLHVDTSQVGDSPVDSPAESGADSGAAPSEGTQDSGTDATPSGDPLWVSPLLPDSVVQPPGTDF